MFASPSLRAANYHNTAKAFGFALANFAAPATRAFLEEALCEITQLMLNQQRIPQQYTTFVESLLRSATALAIKMAREVDVEKYGALLRECIDPRQLVYARAVSDRSYAAGIPRAHGRCCEVALENGAAALVAEALEATEGWPGHTLVNVAVNVAAHLRARAADRPDLSKQCDRALAIVQARFAELSDEELKEDKSSPPLAWLEPLAKSLPHNPRFRFKLDVALKLLRSGSLKFRLLAWDHITSLRHDARASGRTIPSTLVVENSSRYEANGVYTRVSNRSERGPENAHGRWQRKINSEETGRDVAYIIERFATSDQTRTRAQQHSWFISTPSAKGDVDFFHVAAGRSTGAAFLVPPRTGWLACDINVEARAPTDVRNGDPPQSTLPVEEAGGEELMRRWIVENDVVKDVFGDRVHVAMIEKSQTLLQFLNGECLAGGRSVAPRTNEATVVHPSHSHSALLSLRSTALLCARLRPSASSFLLRSTACSTN